MATRTEYLKLIRPDYNDAADIADINANMDAIDAKAKELDESSGKALMEHNQSQAAHAAMAATINALMGPTGNTDTVRNLLNYLANRYKTAAGVSDWKDAPSINLKDVKNFIDQMARGSAVQWNGKKWKNPLTGESGLMDQNGYYCGGPNRANLIIQWGIARGDGKNSVINTFPISFQEEMCFGIGVGTFEQPYDVFARLNLHNGSLSSFTLDHNDNGNVSLVLNFKWIAIGH